MAGEADLATAWQAYLTKGQKKKLKHKENKSRKQRVKEGQPAEDAPPAAWHRSSEWLAGIRKQPLQVRLDLMEWIRRAEVLHSWRELAAWGGSHEGVPL